MSARMPGSRQSKTCTPCKGLCSRTKTKHFSLSGLGEDKAWRTTQAKVYSAQLRSAIVDTFVDDWQQEHIAVSWKTASAGP